MLYTFYTANQISLPSSLFVTPHARSALLSRALGLRSPFSTYRMCTGVTPHFRAHALTPAIRGLISINDFVLISFLSLFLMVVSVIIYSVFEKQRRE